MAKFLIAVEAVPGLDDAFLARLSSATRKPAQEWARSLAGNSLARVLMGAETEAEAQDLAGRLSGVGLVPHIVDKGEAADVIERAFEATWAERGKDGAIFIGADGTELKISSGDMRAISTGRNIVQGAAQHFVTIGLRAEPGAVILRLPGSEVSKLTTAETPEDQLEGVLAAFAKICSHAKVERGLEQLGKLAGLDLAGTKDLAHAGVLSAWLTRRFPPAAPARPVVQIEEEVIPQLPQQALRPRDPRAPIELGDDTRARQADAAAAVAKLEQSAPNARMAFEHRPGDQKQPLDKRVLYAAGAVGLALVVALIFYLRPPSSADRVVKVHEAWKSPYGATFHFRSSYDAGFQGVASIGFVVDVEKGGDKVEVRVPSHEATQPRETLGVSWHIESYDDGGGWIVVAAED